MGAEVRWAVLVVFYFASWLALCRSGRLVGTAALERPRPAAVGAIARGGRFRRFDTCPDGGRVVAGGSRGTRSVDKAFSAGLAMDRVCDCGGHCLDDSVDDRGGFSARGRGCLVDLGHAGEVFVPCDGDGCAVQSADGMVSPRLPAAGSVGGGGVVDVERWRGAMVGGGGVDLVFG